ncbi:hypothetical protein LWI29_008015 [Acer saccharum]|uniref:Uncharacterized protein n=1 Tax=Acer saccharum TaxID=4024 RepID=A0AA39SUI1_ACESA|nr:hypothetical protein LWI29_008015 [Acer saccharum]
MARTRNSLIFIFFLYYLVIFSTTFGAKRSEKEEAASLFIFGDSFLDAGNNNYINTTTLDQANFWPYGQTFFRFPTGRFSDGRLISDFIAEYAKLPLIPPFLQPGAQRYYNGVNFASAGAGALVETFQGDVISLKTQLSYYKKVECWLREKLGNDEAKLIISRAVYLFSIGANDYTSPFLTNNFTLLNSSSHSEYVGIVIGNLTTVIKEIHESGGRKFAFTNLPTLGCLPALRIIRTEDNGRCLKKVSSLAKLHNKALSKLLFDLNKQLKGFKYSIFDMNRRLRERMNHPSKYGFKEGETACCGTGEFRGVFSCGGKRLVKEFQLCHQKFPKKVHVALFIFGDSYFDAGNNNYINTTADYQANFRPYGESFFKYPTGRFSDGRLVSDFIAEYAKLPLISTFLQSSTDQFTSGVNFASAGAGTLVETHQGLVIDLKTQLSYFKVVEQQLKQKLGDAAAKKLISKAVYLFSIGSNDYFTLFSTNSSVLQSHNSKIEYAGMEIYKEGGRKFGFLNLLPLGCIPSMKVLIVPGSTSGNSCQEDGTELAKLHNKALSESLQELERALEGFRYSYHDFYGSLIERMNNPEAYGFKEVTACCGSGTYRGILSCGGKREIKEYEVCEKPSEYLFFDADHPSEMASKQIAELMWSSEIPNVTGPYNLMTLFHHI